jgi:hypothetical protein
LPGLGGLIPGKVVRQAAYSGALLCVPLRCEVEASPVAQEPFVPRRQSWGLAAEMALEFFEIEVEERVESSNPIVHFVAGALL